MLLVETKNVNSLVEGLAKDLGYHNLVIVPASGSSGGAAIFWNDRVKVRFLDNPNLYCNHMSVEDDTNLFWLSYIYGNPVKKYRENQWHHIINAEAAGFLQNKPRMMIGDFNDIKHSAEKHGGLKRSVPSLKLFTKMLAVLGLQDIKTFGGKFTWMGKRAKYTILSKIDRAVANCDWLDMYPAAHVRLLPWIGSDHRPLLVNTEAERWKRKGSFKYDSRWRLFPGLKQVIEQAWNEEFSRLSGKDIHQLINNCRKAISQWRSKQNTNSSKLIQQLKDDIQKAYEAPTIDYGRLGILKAELHLQYRLEEEYWRNKSRVLWLQAGDRNTRFFHAKTKQRRSYNRIIQLQDDQGNIYTKAKDIQTHSIDYFQSLL
ncbi:hypothetical protein N665_0004s0044 [Sinapis alba]|nr:hypothetical protein N665_0004s0044 [Sinapis alba]